MTTVTGALLIGGGTAPGATGTLAHVTVAPAAVTAVDAGLLLPSIATLVVASDGSWSTECLPLPAGYAYEFKAVLGGGAFVYTRTVVVPASGTVKLTDLPPVVAETAPYFAPPIWYADALAAADAASASATAAATSAGEAAASAASIVRGGANGVAPLDGASLLPEANVPTRLTATVQNATIATAISTQAVPRWTPTTAYAINAKVVSPNGDIVSAIAAHTSGASFTDANWNLSPTFVPQSSMPVNIRTLGVKADGTNELAAWQAAIGSGGTFRIPAGDYYIGGGNIVGSATVPTTLIWDAGARLIQTTDNSHFRQAGTLGAQVAVSAGATTGSVELTTSAAHGLVVGDWLFLQSEDLCVAGATPKLGMLRQVTFVTSTTQVSVDAPLYRALPTTPNIRKVTLGAQVKFLGSGQITHSNPTAHGSTAVQISLSLEPIIEIEFANLGSAALGIGSCVGGHFDGSAHDLIDGGDTQAGPILHYGYGVNVCGATRGFRVSGSAARCRHGFTTNGGGTQGAVDGYGEPEGVIVTRNFIVQNTSGTGIDTHEAGFGCILDGIVIGSPIGFNDRAASTTISGRAIGCGTARGTATLKVGVNLTSSSRDARVTASIDSMASGHDGALRILGTGAVIAPFIPAPPTGDSVYATAAYTLAGGLIQGTRNGASTLETVAIGGDTGTLTFKSDVDLTSTTGARRMFIDSPVNQVAGFRFRDGTLTRWAIEEDTSGQLSMTAYDNAGVLVGGALTLLRADKGMFMGSYLLGQEMADPASVLADRGALYFKDDGAGKTQLVVKFNSGAVQVIATQP